MKNVSWRQYAAVYDLMAENNPAYQELVKCYRDFIAANCITPLQRVLDAGAGTGNFSLVAAQKLPTAKIIHLEPDLGMNLCVKAKSQTRQITNLIVDERAIEAAEFPAAAFDVITSVHALYTMPQPQEQLRRFAAWLRPGGLVFLCDFGRVMEVADWRNYLFKHLCRENGLLETLKILWRGRQIARENRKIARLQRHGKYWMHSPDQFRGAVETAGFQILKQELVYRGCSDLIIAKKICG